MKKTKMDLASAIAMYIDAYMPSILQALFGIPGAQCFLAFGSASGGAPRIGQ